MYRKLPSATKRATPGLGFGALGERKALLGQASTKALKPELPALNPQTPAAKGPALKAIKP